MPTLQLGSSGPDVVKLQTRLLALQWDVGRADGKFGPRTEAAVKTFQRSQGLVADGVVGPRTLTALGLSLTSSTSPAATSTQPSGGSSEGTTAPTSRPPSSLLSEKAIQLLLEFEVGGGKSYYDRFLQRPMWPGAFSGVTIGIGYDLGHNTRQTFNRDWAILSAPVRDRLSRCCDVTGPAAKDQVAQVSDIIIPWEMAWTVFNQTTVQRFYHLTRDVFPGFDQLPLDAQGGLVSLIFNRGPKLEGDRRQEMRTIRDLVPTRDLKGIADQIRQMKRLWVGTDIEFGIARRRDAEADLIERAV